MTVVLVPLSEGRTLALEREVYLEALERGQEFFPSITSDAAETVPTVLDAEGMHERTGVPASWWLEAARRGDVPCIRAGKYVRFAFAATIGALERR